MMLYEMSTNFSKWLNAKLSERDISPAELARRSHKSSGAISHVLSGSRNAGASMCIAIAKALNLPEEEVMREAGLLHTKTSDPLFERAEVLFMGMDESAKQQTIKYMEFLADEQRRLRRKVFRVK